MRVGPNISRVAACIADPARANMLCALMGGQALTASELAHEAGIMPQTASAHLSRLESDGLLIRRRQGRNSYFALGGHEVADIIEHLGALAEQRGHMRTRFGPREPEMRRARVCYDHLAGEAGVVMLDSLLARGEIRDEAGSLVLSHAGEKFVHSFGLRFPASTRRPLCKPCLDWSVRRSHLAGLLGAALLARIFELGWARRSNGTRIIVFTSAGLPAFEKTFGPLIGDQGIEV